MADCILVRDGGTRPREMDPFSRRYGRGLSVYGQLPSEKAITEMIGGMFHFSKTFDRQLSGNFLSDCARAMLEDKSDMVFCHLKGPDEPGHDGNPQKKTEAIRRIDQFFFGELCPNLSRDDIVVVSCDHATPCELGIHSADKVPLLVFGRGLPGDEVISFSEKAAEKGKCKVKRAVDVMDFVSEVF